MQIPDLKKAIEGIGPMGDEGKTLKDKLGEIKDNDSLNEFYEEWKKFLKKTYLSLHPDKNPEKEEDFKDFREKTTLINEYIDIFTKNDNGKREFKDSYNQEAFLKSTKAINAINVNDFSNLNSGLNNDSSSSAKSSSRGTSFSSEKYQSFDELCKEIDWSKVFKSEPQKKASWLASVDESGNLVVINSDGKKDLNSKILEKAGLLIPDQLLLFDQNANFKHRFEVESEGISGVILIISNEEMNKKIAQNSDAKVDDKKTREEIIRIPSDLGYWSTRKMMGEYDESRFNTVDIKGIKSPLQTSFAKEHPSSKNINSRGNTSENSPSKGR